MCFYVATVIGINRCAAIASTTDTRTSDYGASVKVMKRVVLASIIGTRKGVYVACITGMKRGVYIASTSGTRAGAYKSVFET
jgi:hypothetical protein